MIMRKREVDIILYCVKLKMPGLDHCTVVHINRWHKIVTGQAAIL